MTAADSAHVLPVDPPRVRGRFAPSPTGPLHLGSLVAALGSFLAARHQGGEWLVRIEDVDLPRAMPGAADAILRSLERCGLAWDGSVLYQSRRLECYQAALEYLLRAGRAYPCSCTRRELAGSARAHDGSPIYPGRCRAGVRHPDRPHAIRLRVPDVVLAFHDAVQGDYRQRLEQEVGDFVIRRADGLFAYQLAVVVDDAAQGVTQIIRGADLLDSTPRQIYLQGLLAAPTPCYGHLPLVTDGHGDKLSKQTHAPPLDDRAPGPALWTALRFLGQRPPAELAAAPATEILQWALAHWQLQRVPASVTHPWSSPFTGESSPNGLTQAAKVID